MTSKTAAKGAPCSWDFIVGKTLIHIECRDEQSPEDGRHICSLPKANVADARLIALAPEMYHALQDILGSGSIREAERIAFAVLDKLKEETHG